MATTSTGARVRASQRTRPTASKGRGWAERERAGWDERPVDPAELGPPGLPSRHGFVHIDDVPPGTVVGRWLRVSGREQDRNDNLANQDRRLGLAFRNTRRRLVEVKVPGFAGVVGSGYGKEYLAAVRAYCRELKKLGATHVVATTVNRLVRSTGYHSERSPDAQPTDRELAAFVRACCGLVPVTLLSTDATPAEERAYLIKLGQRTKRNKGGRPWSDKKAAKAALKAKVLEKRDEMVWSVNRLADWAGRQARRMGLKPPACRTVHYWVEAFDKKCAIPAPGTAARA